PASDAKSLTTPEGTFPKTTTPAPMPETTETPTAPATKPPTSPMPASKPQPAAATQTSVQITFSFEITGMQLTPSFKMGVLKVRPTSKLVAMRLGQFQQPQPAMNLQVAFELATIQPADGGLGTIRLTPSQQRKPVASGS